MSLKNAVHMQKKTNYVDNFNILQSLTLPLHILIHLGKCQVLLAGKVQTRIHIKNTAF